MEDSNIEFSTGITKHADFGLDNVKLNNLNGSVASTGTWYFQVLFSLCS